LWTNFGTEVDFTLNPFVYGTATSLRCFDEAAPCSLEQYSMCIVENYQQETYVPWLICMDTNGDPTAQCDAASSPPVVSADMEACVADDAAILTKYLAIDAPITGTPTVYVQGASVRTSYGAIKRALCKAESGLAGCSVADSNSAEEEIQTFCNPEGEVVSSLNGDIVA